MITRLLLLLVANAIMLTHMLTAVSRLRSVQTGQLLFTRPHRSQGHHRDKLHEKNRRLGKKLKVTCVNTEHDGEIRKTIRKETLTSCSWVVRASAILKPPQRRSGRAHQPLTHALHPETEPEAPPIYNRQNQYGNCIYQCSFINCIYQCSS